MALVKCPECGKEVSSNAATCPNCGCPVPKKMVPVHIARNANIAMAVYCYVYIDGNLVGELKPGKEMTKQLPVGTHNISTESNVRAFGFSAADTRAMSGDQFEICENTKAVSITIKTKVGWTAGRCVVDSIICS